MGAVTGKPPTPLGIVFGTKLPILTGKRPLGFYILPLFLRNFLNNKGLTKNNVPYMGLHQFTYDALKTPEILCIADCSLIKMSSKE